MHIFNKSFELQKKDCKSNITLRLHDNFSQSIAMRFSEVIELSSRGKIATILHGTLANFTDRKLQEYSQFYNSSAIFQKMLHCQHTERTCEANPEG